MRKHYIVSFDVWAMSPKSALEAVLSEILDKHEELLKYGQTKRLQPVIDDTGETMPEQLREFLGSKLVQSFVTVFIRIEGNDTYRMEVTSKEDMGFISPVLLDYYVMKVSAPQSTLRGTNTRYEIVIRKDFR